MRTLIITKIFPNPMEPLASPFNRQQFLALRSYCDVDVFATIPWFPGAALSKRWSGAGRLKSVPRESFVEGMRVKHPRFAYVPRVGHRFAGLLYAASLLPHVAATQDRIDVLLGSWLYPDGFASVLLGRLLGVPVVVKVHGTDLNSLPERSEMRRAIRWTLRSADRIVTVSKPLRQKAIELGAAKDKVDIVRNGVDSSLFHPRDRAAAREKLGLVDAGRKYALFVGRLESSKGVLALLDAFERFESRRSDSGLIFVGDGSARPACEQAAARYGDRVIVAGARPLEEVPFWMAASDVLALPSQNEGTPNVVLEALASGRRVVATAVGGIPALLGSEDLGLLVPPGDPAALADALERGLFEPYSPEAVRRHADVRDWDESAAELHESLVLSLSQQDVLTRASAAKLGEQVKA